MSTICLHFHSIQFALWLSWLAHSQKVKSKKDICIRIAGSRCMLMEVLPSHHSIDAPAVWFQDQEEVFWMNTKLFIYFFISVSSDTVSLLEIVEKKEFETQGRGPQRLCSCARAHRECCAKMLPFTPLQSCDKRRQAKTRFQQRRKNLSYARYFVLEHWKRVQYITQQE